MSKRRIAVDNCTLVALTTKCKESYSEDDLDRLDYLEELLSSQDVIVVIPAPVVAEYLAYHSDEQLATFLDSPRVWVLPFDQCAAEMAAEIEKSGKGNKVVKPVNWQLNSKQVAKVDRQILALCKANSVDMLITDDKGLLSMCERVGFNAQSFRTLLLPEKRKQMKLGLAEAEE